MVQQQNALLNRLDPASLARLKPHLHLVHLAQGQVLAETHQRVQKVYFPHTGIISHVVELSDGHAIETGMVGKDGAFGASQALDDKVSIQHVVVQVPGTASATDSARLCALANELPAFRAILIKYDLFFLGQVQQAVACNAVHDIQNRVCKWLLRMHRLVGDDLPLTQEFLAQMMGVRRSSVSGIAAELQKLGLITYSRGHIHINDLQQVREHACECDDAINSHYQRIFEPNQPLPISA